jgi:hypothetical protein
VFTFGAPAVALPSDDSGSGSDNGSDNGSGSGSEIDPILIQSSTSVVIHSLIY